MITSICRRLEEEDDEKIEEMIDDISTNEMFGSSILSNGDGDNWRIFPIETFKMIEDISRNKIFASSNLSTST